MQEDWKSGGHQSTDIFLNTNCMFFFKNELSAVKYSFSLALKFFYNKLISYFH